MSTQSTCPYCMPRDTFPFGKWIYDLPMSHVYLFHEQSKYGRCILGCKKHVNDISELSDEERNQFFADLNLVCKAVDQCYHPGKINFGSYYDTGRHLHIHIVPKYKEQEEWGTTFTMNPGKIFLRDMDADTMARELVAVIRSLGG